MMTGGELKYNKNKYTYFWTYTRRKIMENVMSELWRMYILRLSPSLGSLPRASVGVIGLVVNIIRESNIHKYERRRRGRLLLKISSSPLPPAYQGPRLYRTKTAADPSHYTAEGHWVVRETTDYYIRIFS